MGVNTSSENFAGLSMVICDSVAGICCFDDILSQPLLRKLTLEVLVGKVLLGFLHSGVGDAATSVERLSAIFKVLPRAWFSGGNNIHQGIREKITDFVHGSIHQAVCFN